MLTCWGCGWGCGCGRSHPLSTSNRRRRSPSWLPNPLSSGRHPIAARPSSPMHGRRHESCETRGGGRGATIQSERHGAYGALCRSQAAGQAGRSSAAGAAADPRHQRLAVRLEAGGAALRLGRAGWRLGVRVLGAAAARGPTNGGPRRSAHHASTRHRHPTTADCPFQPQQQQAGWPGSDAQQSATLILQPRNTMQGVVLQGRRCTLGAANVHKEAHQVAP